MNEIDGIGNGSSGSFDAIGDEIGVEAFRPIARDRLQNVNTNGAKVHRYPEFIAGDDPVGGGDDALEIAKECIRFTAVKQGGVALASNETDLFRKDVSNSIISRANNRLSENKRKSIDLIGQGLSTLQAGLEPTKTVTNRLKALNRIATQNNAIIERTNEGSLDDADLFDGISGVVGFLDRQSTNINQPEEDLEHCFLYMPPSIIFNESATWGKQGLGAAGNAIRQAVKGGQVSSILKEFGLGVAPEVAMATALGTTAKIGGILSAAGLGALGQGVPGAVGQVARIAQNPYEEQLFQGIDFRVFNFQFEFNPVSQNEYLQVKNIIHMFRKHSRPTFTINSDNQALYSYPNEFRIEFLHLNSTGDTYDINTELPKIHNCVLSNITTNYTPSEWRAHSEGEPNSILVQLAFTETVKITREEVEKGY